MGHSFYLAGGGLPRGGMAAFVARANGMGDDDADLDVGTNDNAAHAAQLDEVLASTLPSNQNQPRGSWMPLVLVGGGVLLAIWLMGRGGRG